MDTAVSKSTSPGAMERSTEKPSRAPESSEA